MPRAMRRLIAADRPRRAWSRAAPGPASGAGKRARCGAKHSHTVAKNHLVTPVLPTVATATGGSPAACGPRGRKRLVVREYDDGYVESGTYRDVRLVGRFVAVVFDATDISCKAACPPGYEADADDGSSISDSAPARPDHAHARAGRLAAASRPWAWRRGSRRSQAASRSTRTTAPASPCSTPERSSPPRVALTGCT